MNASCHGVVAIVDDDEAIRTAVKGLLRSVGYDVTTFASAELFMGSGNWRESLCLILDIQMPGIDGLTAQRILQSLESPVPIIFISAHDSLSNRRKAFEAGAVDFLRKPFEASVLMEAIRACFKAREELPA